MAAKNIKKARQSQAFGARVADIAVAIVSLSAIRAYCPSGTAKQPLDSALSSQALAQQGQARQVPPSLLPSLPLPSWLQAS
jgi:hypothetical protein